MTDQKVDEAKGPAKVADAKTTEAKSAAEGASASASGAKSPAKEAPGSDDTSPENNGRADQSGPSLMEKFEHAVRTVKERFTGTGR